MPGDHIRLLALDGGGVRGLSSLMILQQLMATVDPESPPKPCNYFDMIGGTSTGGLIAIMLGRLQMTLDECIEAYTSLSDSVFEKKAHRFTIQGKLQGRFDTAALEHAIKQILMNCGLDKDSLLKDSPDVHCKVFVSATSKQTNDTVCLTSYRSPRGGTHLFNSTKIWQACRATSAATTFFEPIAIGPFDEEFVDGALGANNPIYTLWNQAQDVWGADQLQGKLNCLVSIGTGVPTLKPVSDDALGIWATLKELATETEKTAEQFRRDKSSLDDGGRYYRFNVGHGLEDIGLQESRKKKEIAATTGRYIASQEVFKQLKACRSAMSKADSAEESDVIERELRALPPDIRLIIEREKEANGLRLDVELRIVVVSVPHFQPEDFQHFRAWRESNFRSSTFQLADLLEMLPGQANCERAIFEVKQLRGLKDHEHLYRALCSRLGLAAFICRHFHSLAAQDGHVEIRTTVGAFKIFPQGSTAVIKFLPRDKAFETHQLAAGDFQNVQKFAQGQIRLSPFAFDRVYGREGGENERWKEIPIKLAILTAALDHPQCIRFVTQTELEILETSREICKVVMRTFIRLVDEEPLEGTEAFEQWELIMTVFRQSRDADFVHPDSIRIITEVCGGICKLVCPDDNARGQVLSKVVDDFGEILDILRGEPTARSARVRGYLKEFFERYGLPFVCCFVAQALIASTNCSIFLTISVASPQLWLEFLTGPEVDVFVE